MAAQGLQGLDGTLTHTTRARPKHLWHRTATAFLSIHHPIPAPPASSARPSMPGNWVPYFTPVRFLPHGVSSLSVSNLLYTPSPLSSPIIPPRSYHQSAPLQPSRGSRRNDPRFQRPPQYFTATRDTRCPPQSALPTSSTTPTTVARARDPSLCSTSDAKFQIKQ